MCDLVVDTIGQCAIIALSEEQTTNLNNNMSHRTVSVPNLDETHTESGYLVTLSREDYLTAIRTGESKLGASKVGGAWYYKADETDEVFRLTADEVAAVGVGETDERGWDYSLWCSYTGRLIKRPSKAVREALGMEA